MGKFMPGDVGFIMHHNSKLSKVIAWFMGSKFSHTFMVLEQTENLIYILETSDFQVGISTLDRYIEDSNVSLEVYRGKDLQPEQAQVVTRSALATLGTVYGYLQLISLGLRRLMGRLGYIIPNFIRQGIVCDQVVLTGLVKSPYALFQGMDPKSKDTEDLYQLIKNSECFALVESK